jgi:hypothetical protein
MFTYCITPVHVLNVLWLCASLKSESRICLQHFKSLVLDNTRGNKFHQSDCQTCDTMPNTLRSVHTKHVAIYGSILFCFDHTNRIHIIRLVTQSEKRRANLKDADIRMGANGMCGLCGGAAILAPRDPDACVSKLSNVWRS